MVLIVVHPDAIQGLTQTSNESKVLIRSLETQMLGVKTEFDLAHRSNTSKMRDIENLFATDHEILIETSRSLEEITAQARV